MSNPTKPTTKKPATKKPPKPEAPPVSGATASETNEYRPLRPTLAEMLRERGAAPTCGQFGVEHILDQMRREYDRVVKREQELAARLGDAEATLRRVEDSITAFRSAAIPPGKPTQGLEGFALPDAPARPRGVSYGAKAAPEGLVPGWVLGRENGQRLYRKEAAAGIWSVEQHASGGFSLVSPFKSGRQVRFNGRVTGLVEVAIAGYGHPDIKMSIPRDVFNALAEAALATAEEPE